MQFKDEARHAAPEFCSYVGVLGMNSVLDDEGPRQAKPDRKVVLGLVVVAHALLAAASVDAILARHLYPGLRRAFQYASLRSDRSDDPDDTFFIDVVRSALRVFAAAAVGTAIARCPKVLGSPA